MSDPPTDKFRSELEEWENEVNGVNGSDTNKRPVFFFDIDNCVSNILC